MSYELEKWARMQVVGNSTAKYVLRELTHCHNRETGLCCPSLSTLCEVLELSKNTVKTAIKYLVTKGFIVSNEIKEGNCTVRTEYYFPLFGGSNSDLPKTRESNFDPHPTTIGVSNIDPPPLGVSEIDPPSTTLGVSNSDLPKIGGSNFGRGVGQILTPNQEYITKNTISNSKVNISKTTEEKLGGLRGEVLTVDASTEVDPTKDDLTEDDGVPPWETQARKQWIAQASELASTNTPEPATTTTATTAPTLPAVDAPTPTDSAPASDQDEDDDQDYAVVKGMRVPYDAVFDLYNEIAEGHFKTVKNLNDKRKGAVKARLLELARITKADSLEALMKHLRKVFENAQRSSFCCGYNDKGWQVSFDFAFSPSGFTKLYEDVYANSPNRTQDKSKLNPNRPEKLPEVRDMSVDEIMNAHKKHPNYGQ